MTANLLTLTREKRESPMKRILMSATALSMKKVAFAILACALLILLAAPAWAAEAADPCTAVSEVGCGVLITITGTSGNLVATITGSKTSYDGDDQLVGIQNNSTNAAVGAIILSGPGIFAFDGDGVCNYFTFSGCPFDTSGYAGPDNTFVGISEGSSTGKVLFRHALAAHGGTTWFSLEGAPTNTVAIGENQTLTGNTQSVYKFGPGNPTRSPGPLAAGSEDDFKITPKKTATDDPTGDSLTVTPVPVDPLQVSAGPNFPITLACIPYFDYSSNSDGSNKVATCVELELDCSSLEGGDACNFQYTTQLDYGIYGPGLFNPANTLIGGPHLLVQHDVPCPATGAFTDDIVTTYTGATVGPATSPDPPPIKGSGSPGHSCLGSFYDTNPSVPLIAQGVTVSTFGGFEFPVSNTKTNPILRPLPVPLIWDFNDSSGTPITNLFLCPTTSCSKGPNSPPWVHLSLTALSSTPACLAVAVDPLPSFGGLRPGDEAGEYFFLWDTRTTVKNLKGCQVGVRVQLSTGPDVTPATFQYLY